MDKVIITGVNGFFGSSLAGRLLSKGVKVIGIGTDDARIGNLMEHDDFSFVKASFEDYSKLPEMIHEKDVDVFYHFAWAGGFTTAIRDYRIQMSNAAYAGDALVAAHEIGAGKFVYANTYNQFEIENFLISETFEPRYTCIYSTGKTAASLICRTLAYNLGIEYSAGLVPMPYGENNYSKQLVNVVLNNLNNGTSPKLVEGNNLYDLVYIDDIVDAFIAIGEKGRHMKEYYIGHRALKTFRELITEVRDCVAPDVELKFGEFKDNQQIDYSMVDLDALYRDTGWECSHELKDYMPRTAKWVRENLTF